MPNLRVDIRDGERGQLTPARVQIKGQDGRFYYPEGCIAYKNDNHFTTNGTFTLNLPAGKIQLIVEKGKEFRSIRAELEMKRNIDHHVECELYRWIDMAELGWFSGDIHVHRTISEMRNLVLAEDLNVAPMITVWNDWRYSNDDLRLVPKSNIVEVDRTHLFGILTQEDERRCGAVIILNLNSPIDVGFTTDWYPSGFQYCQLAHEMGALVDQEKTFWWEAPVNVALGGVDTIEILNNHIQRETVLDNEAWGKPRDTNKYPGYMGFIQNVLDQYYHYLNLGLRIPISAGSASGVLKNPLGFNRLYVYTGHNFSYERWFRFMKAGIAFATNGPMIFFSIDDHRLGSTILSNGKYTGKVSIQVLSENELDRVEIIYNGRLIWDKDASGTREVNEEFEMSFEESGWVVARAFEKTTETVKLAHTNPIYIRTGSPMKPSFESAMYYVNWCNELIDATLKDKDRFMTDVQREEVERIYRQALDFYEGLAKITSE